MKNNFNRVTKIYDALAKLVFGKKLATAQKYFLNHVSLNDKVLIVGGGTGEILEWLPSESNLAIDYVELSTKMLRHAEKRKSKGLKTYFIERDILHHEGKYDLIIANFFLDCFGDEALEKVLQKLKVLMKNEGKLMVTDFALTDSKRDRVLNRIMHCFFRLTANLESKALQDIRRILLDSGFKESHYKKLDRGQLFAGVYTK